MGITGTYIGPSNEVVGRFFQVLNQLVIDNFIGQVEASGEFDKLETGFTATRIPTHGDVRFEIGSNTVRTVSRLRGHGCKKEIHTMDESLTAAGTGTLGKSFEKTRTVTVN